MTDDRIPVQPTFTPRKKLNYGNPFADSLGCEVNVCQADHCDAKRMEFCALRKTWLEQTALLLKHLGKVRNPQLRRIYVKRLEGMGYYKTGSGQ